MVAEEDGGIAERVRILVGPLVTLLAESVGFCTEHTVERALLGVDVRPTTGLGCARRVAAAAASACGDAGMESSSSSGVTFKDSSTLSTLESLS